MNQPYFIFAGDKYYARGGWCDYRGRFNSEAEALESIANGSFDWWHIVDVRSGEIIRKGKEYHGA